MSTLGLGCMPVAHSTTMNRPLATVNKVQERWKEEEDGRHTADKHLDNKRCEPCVHLG